VALPVVALVACGAALHPLGPAIPRRAARIGGGLVLALALLWVLPGFAAERLMERAVDNGDPAAARFAATISPFNPAPLRLARAPPPRAARPPGEAEPRVHGT